MSRPGLVVGLGGTGQWVLTWLKRDLLLSNNGRMPPNVRLLAIDTATQLEAGATRITASGAKEEGAEVGDVTLDESEFIYIGGDSKPLAERVRLGQLPQIGKWYQAQRWLDTQAPATFILDDGAGRLRQFGRMAIFKDILGQETGSQTWRAFRSAIDAVRAATTEQRRLEIIVVGSFAGGTGSGMFLDAALILRLLSQNVHHILRGFFALPSVFTTAPDRDMKARTFAAWRELNRFMVINSDFPMSKIEYVENNQSYQIQPEKRLFDACYLVDGRRAGQPLADEAKYGVFPMMAEVISAILDEEAGTAYTQWIFTNLAPEYSKRPETPMYSAVGAYTIQVPAHFVQEISSHQFAQDILKSLLQPGREPDQYGRLVASGAERHLALAAVGRNQEDPGFSGRSRSRSLLQMDASFGNQKAKPTLFMGRIATLNEDAQDKNQQAAIIERLARAGGNLRSPDSWVVSYPDLGDDPDFDAIRDQVKGHMTYDVRPQYQRRDKEKREDFNNRIRKLPDDVRTRFGGTTSSGEEVEEYYGECGDALAEAQNTQLIIFRRLVRLRLLDLLMGRADDAVIARSGKLGYAWDFFAGVVDELETFLALMREVRKRRAEVKSELKYRGLSRTAEQMVRSTEGKKVFWIWEHPQVRGAEAQYLEAQQRLVDVRREDILHTYVEQTAQLMKEVAEEARDTIQRWIWHLATGDKASSLPGIWDEVRQSRESTENAHSFDARTPKVQALLADETLPIDRAELRQALSRWQWVVEYKGQPSRLHLTAQLLPESEGEESTLLADPIQEVAREVRMATARKNQERFLDLARRNFAGVVARTTVAQAIKEAYPEAEDFVKQVANVSAEPLFHGDPQASSRKKSNLIRVMADENDAYFGAMQGELRSINHLNREVRDESYGIQVVGSENPYKLTLVRTDDLYEFQQFSAWAECQEAYEAHLNPEEQLMDPVLLHNFPAEAQAVIHERKLTQEPYDRPFEPLHPRVVMLLEDLDALSQFLYLGMFGMITDNDDGGLYRWELNWEKSSGPQTIWLTRGWNPNRDQQSRPRPDMFNAIHGYVIMRKTQRQGSNAVIDYEFAQRLIDRQLATMKPAGELKMLQDNLQDDGLVGWLRRQAYDADEQFVRPDFRDMAYVAEVILSDRIRYLQQKEQVTAQRKERSGGGPFKVYRPEAEAIDAQEGGSS